MTAEIAILNSSGVALSADSAVTVGKSRVWKNTNKLFSLSPVNDIGLMIFGSGDYCGVPWETVIKLFLNKCNSEYDTVTDCKDDFVKFVDQFSILDERRKSLNSCYKIIQLIDAIFEGEKDIKRNLHARSYIKRNLSSIRSGLKQRSICDSSTNYNAFITEFEELINEKIADVTDRFVPQNVITDIKKLSFEVFRRSVPSDYETGIVFAGFGHVEVFPSLESIFIDGSSKFGLRYWKHQSVNLNTDKAPAAHIIPFAQSDIAQLFFEGIQSGYLHFFDETIAGILKKENGKYAEKLCSRKQTS